MAVDLSEKSFSVRLYGGVDLLFGAGTNAKIMAIWKTILTYLQRAWRQFSEKGMNPGSGVGLERSANLVCGRASRALHLSFRGRLRLMGVSFVTGYFQTPLCLYPTLFCLTNDVYFNSEFYRVYPSQWLYDSFRFELFMTLLW